MALFLLLFGSTVLVASGVEPPSCFNNLRGRVDECYCRISDVDTIHNQSFPLLANLVTRSYFRYYKVNLGKQCVLWADIGKCTRSTCALKTCKKNEVPEGLSDHKNASTQPTCEEEREMSKLNREISDAGKETLKIMEEHHSQNIDFCVKEDEESEEAEFYDLLQNPERYTGYSGEEAHRIWRSIYQENCFKPQMGSSFLELSHKSLNFMCKEKRVYFRAVSGLHASISIHLAAKYPLEDFFGQKWGMNLAEFSRRFLPEATDGEGPHWLKNLYFVYLLEMRAITKALPLWRATEFYTGDVIEDARTKEGVVETVEKLLQCPDTFDEAELFKGPAADEILSDFLIHFRNISSIMDCVTCDKCRLWGKIQIRGLGTALKILFSPGDVTELELERGEIVTIFNAFNQLSHSLFYVQEFRRDMEVTTPNLKQPSSNLFSGFGGGEL